MIFPKISDWHKVIGREATEKPLKNQRAKHALQTRRSESVKTAYMRLRDCNNFRHRKKPQSRGSAKITREARLRRSRKIAKRFTARSAVASVASSVAKRRGRRRRHTRVARASAQSAVASEASCTEGAERGAPGGRSAEGAEARSARAPVGRSRPKAGSRPKACLYRLQEGVSDIATENQHERSVLIFWSATQSNAILSDVGSRRTEDRACIRPSAY